MGATVVATLCSFSLWERVRVRVRAVIRRLRIDACLALGHNG